MSSEAAEPSLSDVVSSDLEGGSGGDLKTPALSDAMLWRSLCSGNVDALGQLYDRHAGLVYGLSLSILGNAQQAEDLTQDLFIKLSEQLNYSPERGALRTFLLVLTRSRAIDRLRSRQSADRSRQRWQKEYLPEPPSLSTDEMVKQEQTQAVKFALAQLPSPEEQVLRLAYYEGLTQAAIAERLEQPLGTVKSRARRGLLKLRQLLKDADAKDAVKDAAKDVGEGAG
ncbi:MAG: sigma-70 family RNA polymerase sigma factor [Cyanobacteria bacterium J06598_1]